jgi:hypothetical protein
MMEAIMAILAKPCTFQKNAITEAIDSALNFNKNATTARVGFRADPMLILQLSEQDVAAQIDGNRTILNW